MVVPTHSESSVETAPDTGTSKPRARQEAALVRWLQSQANKAPNTQTFSVKAHPLPPTVEPVPPKVRTLREALTANGLAIVPDPLHRYPCTKVSRVVDLL